MVQISCENSKPFWSIRSGRVTPLSPSTPLFKGEGLRDIWHNISIGKMILGVTSVAVSYLILYDSLLQNATDIIAKCDSYFIAKCDRSLLQNGTGFLLQNATVLLQNATVITKCYDFITKYDRYYKIRRLLRIARVHTFFFLVI